MNKTLVLVTLFLLTTLASAQKKVSGSGCLEAGAEDGCMVLTDQKTGTLYDLKFSGKKPDVGTAITFDGTEGEISECQQGTRVNVSKYTVLKMKCDKVSGTTVVVYKYDGTRQCGEGKEIALAEMEKELVSAGITVLDRMKDHDGKMYPQVCGGANGAINAYRIAKKDKAKALNLGFKVREGSDHKPTKEMATVNTPSDDLMCYDVTAWHNRMPGSKPTLHVKGKCKFPKAGYKVELSEAVPQGLNPRILILEVKVTSPSGPTAQVETEVEFQYSKETGAMYDAVTLRGATLSIPVKTTT